MLALFFPTFSQAWVLISLVLLVLIFVGDGLIPRKR